MIIDALRYGAVGDGVFDNTAVLQKALDSLEKTGGTLYFPAGQYVSGSLYIHSDTTVELGAGATLLGSENYDLYPVIGEDMLPGFVRGTRRGILFSLGEKNVTVKGEGTIDGRGYNWWKNYDKGESDERRPRTIQFINCERVCIAGIRITNSPCWTVHPIHCKNVLITGITIENPYDSPNTDGINPESCSGVRISDSYIDVGDDCVTIKSGLERDIFPKAYPCENITVTNCTFVHGHGGIVIGSEMSGGVRNLTVTNCVFRDTDRGIRVKTRRKRGGTVENVIISNVIMENVIAGITMNMYYKCGASADDTALFTKEPMPVDALTPEFRGIIISGVIMRGVRGAAIYFLGLPERAVHDVKIMNCDIEVPGSENGEMCISAFDNPDSFGDGICLKNAENVTISDCSLSAEKEKFIFENVKNISINGEKFA